MLIHEVAPLFDGTELAVQRATLDGIGAQAELPPDLGVEREAIAGVPAEWLSPPRCEDRVVLHLHGGGFAMGSCTSHRALAANLAIACKARLALPEYRLAPEHPFPAGLDDAVEVYAALLAQGIGAEQIVVSGDSAGGGLALSTMLKIAERGLARPCALVLLSPWTDLTLSGESIETRAAVDPWLRPHILAPMRGHYLVDTDPSHPLVSPLQGDLSALPPTLIQVGDHEILLSDSTRLAERARAAGVDVDLQVSEELWHVFQLFAPALPDANEAFVRIGEFVDRCFQRG
jgi:epsilon-lactone hydrolase